jgi:hypothetical protein
MAARDSRIGMMRTPAQGGPLVNPGFEGGLLGCYPMVRVCRSLRPSCALLFLAVVLDAGGATSVEIGADLALSKEEVGAEQLSGYYRLGRDYELGREVEKDLYEAARQYELAAKQGHAEAQYALALILVGAVPESPRSPRKSFRWFGEAARKGHVRAAYFLALSYQNGAGTEVDSEKAFEWFRRSAMGGDGEAMNALARMYTTGAGIRQNLANAYAWNEVAGARGYELAQQFKTKLVGGMSEEEVARGEKLVHSLMRKYGGSPEIISVVPAAAP